MICFFIEHKWEQHLRAIQLVLPILQVSLHTFSYTPGVLELLGLLALALLKVSSVVFSLCPKASFGTGADREKPWPTVR